MESFAHLLSRIWHGVPEATFDHLILVPLFTALVLLLIRSLRNRILDLSGYFVPVKIHGKWDTTIERDKKESPEPRFCTGSKEEKRDSCESTTGEPTPKGESKKKETLNGDASEEPKEEDHETAVLHQFFNKVWGKTESKDDPEITFKVRGQIIGEKLTLVYRETEGFKCGAILLEIKSLRLMEGVEVGCHRETTGLFSKTYTWKRRTGRLN